MAFFSTDTILETINMIKLHNLDIRTVTLALSLRDCASENVKVCADKIRKKISKYAKNLGTFAKEIEQEYREAKSSEKNLMKFIQNLLAEQCNLSLNYEEFEEMLILSANLDCIRLTKIQLALLKSCAEKVDTLLIAPIYTDDDEDTCSAIRIVLSIDLIKEE